MRKYFITGLAILLPLALTLIIVFFLFNLLTDPFAGMVKAIFDYYNLFQRGFWFLTAEQLRRLISKVLILFFLFFLTVGIGFIARLFFVRYLIRITEKIFHKLPFISTIYNTSKDVIKTIFRAKRRSFKQVVFVPFPNENTYSLGLVTRERISGLEGTPHAHSIAVFVPTTPNPTSGFLMLYKPEDVVLLEMSVEDALKYTISCGVIMAPFKAYSKEEAREKIAEWHRDQDDDEEEE